MWSIETLKKVTGVDVDGASQDQLTNAYVKQIGKSTDAQIAACTIAYFMERRGLTFDEASSRTGRSASTIKKDAARASVLVELNVNHAAVVFSHLAGMKDTDARALAEALALVPEAGRMDAFLNHAASVVVLDRCPTWTAEQQADAVAFIVSRGIATKDKMKGSLIAFAEAYDLALTVKKREPQPNEDAPTAARAAKAVKAFEDDREAAEGEFIITDEEAAQLAEAARTIVRTLRHAGRAEELDALAEFLAESFAMIS